MSPGEASEVVNRMREAITFPKVGSHVWTIRGLHQHAHAKGVTTDVPPHTGGEIISAEKPWYAPTVGSDIYVIRWQNGQVTEHTSAEFSDIVVLGPFTSLVDFEEALQNAESAEVVFGIREEFKEFKAVLRIEGQELLVHFGSEQAQIWNYFWPVLVSSNVDVRKTVRPHSVTS